MYRMFNTGGTVPISEEPLAGESAGFENTLSNYAGPYVTDMLAKGAALSDMPYTAYEGPLTAGSSALQDQAFAGYAGSVSYTHLTLPTILLV